MGRKRPLSPTKTSDAEVRAFLQKASLIHASVTASGSGEPGRLLFAMDATASREPTWDQACQIQSEMFSETAALGGLEIQLCYYRGFGEFETTQWLSESHRLLATMARVRCGGGVTQIARVLKHTIDEKNRGNVDTLVFVGDCMEEDIDLLCGLAGDLGILGVPIFVFQEAADPVADRAFREIARLSKGAFCRFEAGSPRQLRELLNAAAVYAAGGKRALAGYGKSGQEMVHRLTHQLGNLP